MSRTTEDADVDDVIVGLEQPVKRLPCRLLYGADGAELFERITETEDYYLTRSELALLAETLPTIARAVGPRSRVIEPGSGSAKKTRALLSALDSPAIYVPIDVASAQLGSSVAALRAEYPALEIVPVTADFTRPITLPAARGPFARTLVFFPGSTIGNFEPQEARRFLSGLTSMAGESALLLLGADSNNDPSELIRAYDDRDGWTAAFNRNVLAVLNATHGVTFEPGHFDHRAVWNADHSRVEMHLVSRCDQSVEVLGKRFTIDCGEHIVTEYCYKHTPSTLQTILSASGWSVQNVFVDTRQRMRLWLATVKYCARTSLP